MQIVDIDPDQKIGNEEDASTPKKEPWDEFIRDEIDKIQGGECNADNESKASDLPNCQLDDLKSEIRRIERKRSTQPR